ncbi:response regulator transcription factor [Floricoccus penangensis]|uniref:response regulator transcription factor n=1 Tax=Floricoccus penangensis TaxID=1859475 RepID=UPI00203BD9BF|nr:response regulator transcription factor [Floricoccus penangensis]URZ87315.1 response regulator transcription factor [Floricoccus penangensis]
MSYPIIICEDNQSQLNMLQGIVENYIMFHGEHFRLGLKSQNPDEVLKYISNYKPNGGIYFLDYDLSHNLTGIDLAEKIRASDVQAKIIFITTHGEVAPKTLKRRVEPLAFIDKNQGFDEFRAEIASSLSIAQERIASANTIQGKNFSFKVGSQIYNIKLDDILFFEPSEIPHRLVLLTKNAKFEFYGKLSEVEKTNLGLFRISRYCIVNPENIRLIDYKTRDVYFDKKTNRRFSLGKGKKLKEMIANRGVSLDY